MQRRIFSLVMLLVLTLTFSVCNVYAEDTNKVITNKEFAEILVNMMGIELPADVNELSEEEYFEVLANALASRGLTNFVGAKHDEALSSDDFIDIAFKMVGGEGDLTLEEKILLIAQKLPGIEYDLNSQPTLYGVTNFLNNPVFAPLVVEAYRPVEELFGGSGEAPGFTLEDTPGVPQLDGATGT